MKWRLRSSDSGNRAFWILVAASLAVRALVAFGICCLAVAVFRGLHDEGADALWSAHPALLPGVLVLAVTGIGLARGAWSLGRSLWRTREFAREMGRYRTVTPPRLQAIADRLGLEGLVHTVETVRPFALTYGLARPRVLVSTGLLAALTDSELAAVLAHERAHVRSRDPLKNVLARAIPARHFYLPALTRLRLRFTVGRELAADRAAVAEQGTGALAGSLLKVTDGPGWAKSASVAAMATADLLDVRIAQLETGSEPPLPRPGRMAGTGTAVAAIALVTGAAWSALIVAHYMPDCMALL